MPRVRRYPAQTPAPTLDEIERDRHAARDLNLQAAAGFQTLRREVMSQSGLSARDAAEAAALKMGELRNDMLKKAGSARMQAMLDDVLQHRADIVQQEFDAHVERATAAANLEQAKRLSKLARQDAAEATTPLAFHTNVRTMLDAIQEHGRLAGHDPAEISAAAFRELSGLHADRIVRKLDDGDIDGAIGMQMENADALSAAEAARIAALLAEPKALAASANRIDQLMGAQTRNGDAPFSYADPLHGAGRTPIPGGRFGAKRTYAGKPGSHKGLDLPAPFGTPVYTSAPGVVTVGSSKLGGNIVTVTHADGSITKYMHLGEVRVKTGDRITPDTIVGTVGTTGRGTGPHIHYEIWQGGKPVDPATLLRRIEQSSRDHDVDALIAAVRANPDLEFPNADRERDVAEIVRRTTQAKVAMEASPLIDDGLSGLAPQLQQPAIFDASLTAGFENTEIAPSALTDLTVDPDPTSDARFEPRNLSYNPEEDGPTLTNGGDEAHLLQVSGNPTPATRQSVSGKILENNGPSDQLHIGIIPGREAARYNKHDLLILNAVNRFNRKHNLTPNDPRYLWATLVKAVAMQESSTSPQWDTDTMQVNKKGDWADAKAALGLKQGTPPDPATSIRAAIEWLYMKGFNTPASDPSQGPQWMGWNYAVQKYNGNEDLVPNVAGGVTDNFTGKPISAKQVQFRYVYTKRVLDFYEGGKKSLPRSILRGSGQPARTPPAAPRPDEPLSPFGPPHIGFRRRMRII